MLLTIVAFIVAILLLVSLHELGHLVVARWCGVKVLRFSIGFGKPFFCIKRANIEWCLAPIPLGGYVKMVDTREGDVSEADLPYAFDQQHPLKRIAIVVAGPLTNLILAVMLYAASFSIGGITQIRPWIGIVEPASVAADAGFQSGDRIISVNGQTVTEWTDAQAKIMLNLDSGKVRVDVITAAGQPAQRQLNIAGTDAADNVAKTSYLGIMPFKVINQIGMVVPDSVAAKAGLRTGDTLLTINGRKLINWQDWVDSIRASAGAKLDITYQRSGQTLQTSLRPDSVLENGTIIGQVGVGAMRDKAWDAQIRRHYQPSFFQSIQLAMQRTWDYITLTLSMFAKLLTGQASLHYLSGPLTIADVAGKTAAIGWQSYTEFLALVSVSLGVLNLLPVPVLDGGHLLYYAIEWIRGKPLSLRIQEIGLRFGIAAMLMLMLVAFFNDITRLFG
ncbi:RIP metalloprotease RseP [Snodgrassella communis]|uniref:RIP metalloprotease RseP n=1 Tax=Snodgrassella communis TaxID=2946699 RepID=UPI001EF54C7A|nr:RIP metalloprotease RseP [Snodgrassella communis]